MGATIERKNGIAFGLATVPTPWYTTFRICYFRQVSCVKNVIGQSWAIAPGAPGRRFDSSAPLRCEPFASRLVLPFRSDRLDEPPSLEIGQAAERSNSGVLGFLLQGVDLEALPRPADERLAEALAPLRMKLDTIIDMLARLSYRDVELPPLCEVELAPEHIAWRSPVPLRRGDWYRIELYFHPIFREPIMAFGKVTNSVEQSRDEGFRIETELIEMPEMTGQGLARLALLTQRHQQARCSVPTVGRREA
jgi:hypothetical protein